MTSTSKSFIQSDIAEKDDAFLNDITSWIPSSENLPAGNVGKLTRPIVIPRIDVLGRLAVPLPFLRAYSFDLKSHGINETEFVAFIDTLAVCQAAPVPLQMLDKAGMIVGAVPHHWAMGASAGMRLAAGMGTAATTKIRTRRCMEKINREFLAPRGLIASICKNEELVSKLGHHAAEVDLEQENHSIVESVSLVDRRMRSLTPYIAPLTFDVPPPAEQRYRIDQISAKAIDRERKQIAKKQQKKMNKNRRRQEKMEGPATIDEHSSDTSSDTSSQSSLDTTLRSSNIMKSDKKMRKMERKAARKLEKQERSMQKAQRKMERKSEKRSEKVSHKNDKEERKEQSLINRMEFLVIENLSSLNCITSEDGRSINTADLGRYEM